VRARDGAELEYEISSGSADAQGDGSSQAGDVVVAFRGADEALLLEHNAELLLALEHVGHRWLRLDPRLHDHVRFDCGDYRTTRLEELKLSARVAAPTRARDGPTVPIQSDVGTGPAIDSPGIEWRGRSTDDERRLRGSSTACDLSCK